MTEFSLLAMMRGTVLFQRFLLTALGLSLSFAAPAAAEETRLTVRALAGDAKFIGSSMSGMEVLIRDADTGELLDRGVTRGATGDTARILQSPRERYRPLSTQGAAAYLSVLDLDRPRRISVTVRGPLSQPQARAEASSTRWVFPGKHIEEGDGWLIDVPGLAVDVLGPAAHSYLEKGVVTVSASVVMLCGCNTSPGGTWDADEMEIEAHVLLNGEPLSSPPMRYADRPSHYTADIDASRPGVYEVSVTAYDPRTGNTGLDRTSFVVR